MIKSSILSQLNLPVGHQHHHQHNVNHQPDDEMKVNHNQPCYLTKTERNILSDIFIMIRKTPEGTIDINEFSTNQQIIDKLQGLNTNCKYIYKNFVNCHSNCYIVIKAKINKFLTFISD